MAHAMMAATRGNGPHGSLEWTGLWVCGAATGEEIRYLPMERKTPGERVARTIAVGNHVCVSDARGRTQEEAISCSSSVPASSLP